VSHAKRPTIVGSVLVAGGAAAALLISASPSHARGFKAGVYTYDQAVAIGLTQPTYDPRLDPNSLVFEPPPGELRYCTYSDFTGRTLPGDVVDAIVSRAKRPADSCEVSPRDTEYGWPPLPGPLEVTRHSHFPLTGGDAPAAARVASLRQGQAAR
jgi:hypothetical protein